MTDLRRVRVLGPVGIDGVNGLRPQLRNTLAALVLVGPEGASMDRLSGMIWDARPKSWESSFRTQVKELREVLGFDAIEQSASVYRLCLPQESVDVWHLRAIAAGEARWDPQDFGRFFGSTAIAEGLAETPPDLEEEVERLETLRDEVLLRRVLVDSQLTAAMKDRASRRAVVRYRYDDLVEATVLALRRCGDFELASRVLREILDVHCAEGYAPSDVLVELVRVQAEKSVGHEGASAMPRQRRAPLLVGRTGLLEEVEADLESPDGPRIVVLEGQPGIGKSATIAEIAWRAEKAGWKVRATVASQADNRSYESLLPLFPTLRTEAFAGELDRTDSDATAAWLRVLAELQIMGDEAVLFVIDDVHFLDSASHDLLRFLARAPLLANVRFLSAADTTHRSVWEPEKRTLARTTQLRTHEVRPLTAGEVRAVVDHRYPDHPISQRHHLTSRLVQSSKGVPMLIRLAIENVDSDTLRPLPRRPQAIGDEISSGLPGLSPIAEAVAMALAAIGHPVSLSFAFQAAGSASGEQVSVLEELVEAGLVHESSEGDLVDLASPMIREALLARALRLPLRKLYARVAGLETDPLRRANQLLHAYPECEDETEDAVLRATRIHLANNNPGEAVDLLERLRRILDVPVPVEADVDHAVALDALGAPVRAASQRQAAIQRALMDGRPDLASRAARGGLPGAEIGGGDPIRLEHLDSVPIYQLDQEHALGHAVETLRQAALLGRQDLASTYHERAIELSETEQQLAWVESAAPRRPSQAPAERKRRWANRLPAEGDVLTAQRLLHLRLLDEFSLGNVHEAMATHERYAATAYETNNGRERWYAGLFESMLLQSTGDWQAAEESATTAYLEAAQLGYRDALAVMTAQSFVPIWMSDRLPSLAPLVSSPNPEIDASLLSEAGLLAVRASVGSFDEGAFDSFIHRAIEQPDPLGLPGLLVVSHLIEATPSAEAVVELLRPQAGTFVIAGGGVCNLGPADRYLARLGAEASRTDHLDAAVDLSDRAGMHAWSARCRLDRWSLTGASRDLREAQAIVADTPMKTMLAE